MNSTDKLKVTKKQLKAYYQNIFPFDLFIKWVTLGNTIPLKQRYFTFSIRPNDDVLNRDFPKKYIDFTSIDDFRSFILREVPYRIDMEAVRIIPAKKVIKETFGEAPIAKYKSLVFDIDMDPFNWDIIKMIGKKLDIIIRNIFGFQHLLYVFSGKKGIHCWVCDTHCLGTLDSRRLEIVEYINYHYPQIAKYIDTNVILMGHNSKVPFSIHPLTGYVCTPFNIDDIDKVNPLKLPTIHSKKDEIKPYIEYFRDSFLSELLDTSM